MANLISRLWNEDQRKIRKIEKSIKPILAMEDTYRQMSDAQLQAETPRLRALLAEGKS